MVLTLLHEGQQRIHRRKEQNFKPSVNILFVNCLNPKCGHSAACPLTCFLSFNILFFFKRVQSYVEPQNLTNTSEFLLMGLSDDPELQPFLFILFLSTYLVSMLGNLLIILAVTSDPHLHTPMYFFLSNPSLADIDFISTTILKMILDIQTHSRVISYAGCLTQMFFFMLFGCLDSLLLTVMAYGQFVAICHPLHYLDIMNRCLRGSLVLVSLFISLLVSQMHNSMVIKLTDFKDVEVSHFFCDTSQLFNLACSDPFTNNIFMYFCWCHLSFSPYVGDLFLLF